MAQVEIISEREMAGGWLFETQVLDDEGVLRRHRLRLSWADYDLWCRGGETPPARIAEAVLGFLLTRLKPGDLRPSFDASIARRYDDSADREIPTHVARP